MQGTCIDSYIEANVPKDKEPWFPIPALVAPSVWHCLLCVIVSLWHVRSAQTSAKLAAETEAKAVLEATGLPREKLLLKSQPVSEITDKTSSSKLHSLASLLLSLGGSCLHCLQPFLPLPLPVALGPLPFTHGEAPPQHLQQRGTRVPTGQAVPGAFPAWCGLAQVPSAPRHAQKCLGSC